MADPKAGIPDDWMGFVKIKDPLDCPYCGSRRHSPYDEQILTDPRFKCADYMDVIKHECRDCGGIWITTVLYSYVGIVAYADPRYLKEVPDRKPVRKGVRR